MHTTAMITQQFSCQLVTFSYDLINSHKQCGVDLRKSLVFTPTLTTGCWRQASSGVRLEYVGALWQTLRGSTTFT